MYETSRLQPFDDKLEEFFNTIQREKEQVEANRHKIQNRNVFNYH